MMVSMDSANHICRTIRPQYGLLFFALHNVLTKKELKTPNPTAAVFTTIGINTVFLWALGAYL